MAIGATTSIPLSELPSPGSSGELPYAVAPYSDRSCSAEETFRRIEPHLSAYGVTRLGRLTGLDRVGIPVWQAVSPNARSIVICHGKGITDIDAKVSAAMEALERATASFPTVTTVVTSRTRLAAEGREADPLPSLIAAGQADIAEDEEIVWVQGDDLISGRKIWVPKDAVALDRTVADPRFWQSSDGLASGNDLTEATLHGLLERIERDAEVLWEISEWQARMSACIDPASLADPVLDTLLSKIEPAGLTLKLFDNRSDIGIPVFTALLGPTAISGGHPLRYLDVTRGCGAPPSPVRAAIRAVTEAAQSRLTLISGARDDIGSETFERALPEAIRRCFEAEPTATAQEGVPLLRGAEALLQFTLTRLRDADIDTAIAVSLGDPSLPFAVAKLIVPQLENPAGTRKRRFVNRAISKTLSLL